MFIQMSDGAYIRFAACGKICRGSIVTFFVYFEYYLIGVT
jgi:hypothetical protein